MLPTGNKVEVISLYTVGGIAALLQLGTPIVMMIVMVTLGERPISVEQYFTLQLHSLWVSSTWCGIRC
jgi:hypothetical protein